MAEKMDATGETRTAATESVSLATTTTTTTNTTTKTDDYSLMVKQEYILNERAASLPPLPVVATDVAASTESEKAQDDRDGNNGRDRNRNKKKNRGQNKKRPRDARQDDGEKICMAVMRGDPCPKEAAGQECRFSHDLEAFMKTRPDDINVDVCEGKCPNFSQFGQCMYGAMCRFGSVHIDKAGRNVKKQLDEKEEDKQEQVKDEDCEENVEAIVKTPKTTGMFFGQHDEGIKNHLPRDVAIQLRKKKYPFTCKRHFEQETKEKNDDTKKTEEKEENTVDATKDSQTTSTETAVGDGPAASFTPIDKPKVKRIVDFSNKVYVAPLTTVGNLPFRRIMKGFGADITCGEMAVVSNLLQGQPSEWALLKRHPSEDVFGVQLAAAHADQYTRVSELIDKYCEVDFVDLNLGCPLDILCNKGAGAALMQRDRKLKPILGGMSATLSSACITVKMRTGWDMGKPFAHTLVPKIQSWGVDGLAAIMVHGRSRLQRYKLDANWDYISQVANSESSENPIPIIGNGDIFSYRDYEEKVLAHPNLSPTAMLGRGALIKPWLPTEIKEKRDWDISASERLDMLKEFVKFGLEHWGTDQQGVNKTRRFLLEWLSFLHRYVPVGLIEVLPQKMNMRPPVYSKSFCHLDRQYSAGLLLFFFRS
mmetsp:Transcript_34312/g.82648  ORF Transcript_34312/g.82648 Transcript_34312/m.82648 type:complete len:650 (-) Transcript_34312:212-2161(-)